MGAKIGGSRAHEVIPMGTAGVETDICARKKNSHTLAYPSLILLQYD